NGFATAGTPSIASSIGAHGRPAAAGSGPAASAGPGPTDVAAHPTTTATTNDLAGAPLTPAEPTSDNPRCQIGGAVSRTPLGAYVYLSGSLAHPRGRGQARREAAWV